MGHILSEGGNGNPPQYPSLQNPMDRGAWQSTVHGVARVWYDLVTKPPAPHRKSKQDYFQAGFAFTTFQKFIECYSISEVKSAQLAKVIWPEPACQPAKDQRASIYRQQMYFQCVSWWKQFDLLETWFAWKQHDFLTAIWCSHKVQWANLSFSNAFFLNKYWLSLTLKFTLENKPIRDKEMFQLTSILLILTK